MNITNSTISVANFQKRELLLLLHHIHLFLLFYRRRGGKKRRQEVRYKQHKTKQNRLQ